MRKVQYISIYIESVEIFFKYERIVSSRLSLALSIALSPPEGSQK